MIGCRGLFRFRKELFQTKVKIHKRFFALLLVFALVIGLLPSVLADNEPSTAESAEETLVESQPEESPAIAPPTQSILESDEAVEDSEVEAEIEAPTSMDGETLTRILHTITFVTVELVGISVLIVSTFKSCNSFVR